MVGNGTVADPIPPYHPSYGQNSAPRKSRGSSNESSSTSINYSSDDDDDGPLDDPVLPDASSDTSVRLGSEGWEVRRPPAGRQEMDVDGWRHDVDVVAQPGRYRRYVSEWDDEEEEEKDEEEVEEEGEEEGRFMQTTG